MNIWTLHITLAEVHAEFCLDLIVCSRGPGCIYLGAVQVQSWVGRRLSRSVIGKSRRRAPIIPWDNDSLAQLTINRSLRSSTSKPCWTKYINLRHFYYIHWVMRMEVWKRGCEISCVVIYFTLWTPKSTRRQDTNNYSDTEARAFCLELCCVAWFA